MKSLKKLRGFIKRQFKNVKIEEVVLNDKEHKILYVKINNNKFRIQYYKGAFDDREKLTVDQDVFGIYIVTDLAGKIEIQFNEFLESK